MKKLLYVIDRSCNQKALSLIINKINELYTNIQCDSISLQQYKNQGINLSTTGTTSVLSCPTSATFILKQIQVDNSSGNPVNLSVQVTDTSASATFSISRKAIAANTVSNIITQTLVLEGGDILKMTAGTADEIQGIISYAQIDRSQQNG